MDDAEELENEAAEAEDEGEDEGSETRGITAPKGRATPGRRTQEVEEEKAESGIVSGINRNAARTDRERCGRDAENFDLGLDRLSRAP